MSPFIFNAIRSVFTLAATKEVGNKRSGALWLRNEKVGRQRGFEEAEFGSGTGQPNGHPFCRAAWCGAGGAEVTGAGEGNRTLVISLGSWSNAIIRHPLSGALCTRTARRFEALIAIGGSRAAAPVCRRPALHWPRPLRWPAHAGRSRSDTRSAFHAVAGRETPAAPRGCRGRPPCAPCPGNGRRCESA